MSESPRDKLRSDIESRYDKLVEMLDAAMTAEKRIKVTDPCNSKGCSCKHFRYVMVPDYDMKMKIAEFMLNQGFGRPAQADPNQNEDRVIFKRLVRLEDPDEGQAEQ